MRPTREPADWDMESGPIAWRDHGWVLRIAHSVHQYDADADLARTAGIAGRKGELRRGADFYLSDYGVRHRQYIGEPSDL